MDQTFFFFKKKKKKTLPTKAFIIMGFKVMANLVYFLKPVNVVINLIKGSTFRNCD